MGAADASGYGSSAKSLPVCRENIDFAQARAHTTQERPLKIRGLLCKGVDFPLGLLTHRHQPGLPEVCKVA
jgi:hypothetical protein